MRDEGAWRGTVPTLELGGDLVQTSGYLLDAVGTLTTATGMASDLALACSFGLSSGGV